MSKKASYSDFPDTISFTVTSGTILSGPKQYRPFNASNLAADIEKIAKMGVDSYSSYATKGGGWSITIKASAPGAREQVTFDLSRPSEHKKIDQFFASLNSGYEFISATGSGNVVTLTRSKPRPKVKPGQATQPRTADHLAGQTYNPKARKSKWQEQTKKEDSDKFLNAYRGWKKQGL
jgi:hypothetical protein